MDLEEHAVEEEVVGRGPVGGVPGQAGEDELLGAGREGPAFTEFLCSGPTVCGEEALRP